MDAVQRDARRELPARTRRGWEPRHSNTGAEAGKAETARATASADVTDPFRTQVIRLGGNLRNDEAVSALERESARCIRPGRRRVVLDLEAAADADTRLIAALVDIYRKAHVARVAWELLASARVRAWIALYKLEKLLRPLSAAGKQD